MVNIEKYVWFFMLSMNSFPCVDFFLKFSAHLHMFCVLISQQEAEKALLPFAHFCLGYFC